MKEIRLGTIGSGTIVHSILDHVNIVEGIRLVAVYSRSEEKGKALAKKYGVDNVYTDMDAFLKDKEVNFVYIATPNILHYEQMKKALSAGKNVICEKPFCVKVEQARELVKFAKEKHLFLIDAVPTAFLPNLEILRRELPKIGKVKLVLANYSQYSSRYNQLLNGEIPNIFNPQCAGGCLMDINFYNVYLNIALFGRPREVIYYPNICTLTKDNPTIPEMACITGCPDGYDNRIDTSGILIMCYDGFVSQSAGAKDTWGVNYFQIEGEKGYIYVAGGSNGIAEVKVVTKTSEECFNEQFNLDRRFYEVKNLTDMVLADDYDAVYGRLNTMLDVVEILELARKKAGILFPGDGI